MSDHREYAVKFFNDVWTLLDKPGRSAEEDVQMIHLAHASRAHWQFAGGPREWCIGEWQIARVYAVVGLGVQAQYHGRQSLDLAMQNKLGPFLEGCAHEVLARAFRVKGLNGPAEAHRDAARSLVERLTDPEEREVLLADLESQA